MITFAYGKRRGVFLYSLSALGFPEKSVSKDFVALLGTIKTARACRIAAWAGLVLRNSVAFLLLAGRVHKA